MLEVLQAERNADDRQTEDDAQDDFLGCQRQAAQQHPNDIEYKRRAAFADADLSSERDRRHHRELEALHTDRDPDDGHAPQKSDNYPGNKADETTQYKPNQIH